MHRRRPRAPSSFPGEAAAMHEAVALAVLAAAGGPLAPRRGLLEAAGSAPAALADAGAWARHGLSAAQASALRTPAPSILDAVAHWRDAPGRHVIGWTDVDYPPALRNAASP